MSVTSKASNTETLPRVLGSFGTGDVQTNQGPLWFVTNGLCEPAYWDASVFDHYGAAYQENSPYYEGKTPYPLTETEERYVCADGLLLPHYCTDLHLGYTVWWKTRSGPAPHLNTVTHLHPISPVVMESRAGTGAMIWNFVALLSERRSVFTHNSFLYRGQFCLIFTVYLIAMFYTYSYLC